PSAVGAGVGNRVAAGIKSGNGVGTAPRDRDRVVVPAVCVRGAPGRRSDDGSGRVVPERKGDHAGDISRLVRAASRLRSASVVGPAVGNGGATGDPGGGVGAAPVDSDGVVVPAVLVGSPGCSGRDVRGRGRVVLERKRDRGARVAGLVGAGSARGCAGGVCAVGQGRGAGGEARSRVRARPADRDRVVVPAVYVRTAAGGGGHRRRGVVELERVRDDGG